MKKLLIGILTMASLSSQANFYETSSQDIASPQELIVTCSEGYSTALKKINKHWRRFQSADDYVAALGAPLMIIGGIAFGPLVLLPPLGYGIVSDVIQKRYEGLYQANGLFQASQNCVDNGSCKGVPHYNLLQDVQKYLKKKGTNLSVEEIADTLVYENQNLTFCTKRIKKSGDRTLKTFKALKKEILKIVKD